MIPEIIEIPEKIIVGRNLTLGIDDYNVFPLWKQFRNEQSSNSLMGVDLYAIQQYAEWPPKSAITHWAGMEKKDGVKYPEEWLIHRLSGGIYARFIHRGTQAEFPKTMAMIFTEWLPSSPYHYDSSRAQFQIMSADYVMNDPESEEFVFIPIAQ
ncbi:MAG: GyrI-like domain-containing protein [Ignavibacteria bacterium]